MEKFTYGVRHFVRLLGLLILLLCCCCFYPFFDDPVKCFRGRPDEAIGQLRERFRLDLNDRACREYVYSLVDNSMENWRTDWYDRYQRYFVGVL
jgi:phosphatidylinositol kinase/protein kinase (PI-3  family)